MTSQAQLFFCLSTYVEVSATAINLCCKKRVLCLNETSDKQNTLMDPIQVMFNPFCDNGTTPVPPPRQLQNDDLEVREIARHGPIAPPTARAIKYF